MKIKFLPTLLILFIICISCNRNKHTRPRNSWSLVYKTDKNGNKIIGDKNELISFIRKGHPIRVGWRSKRRNDTTKTVEHLVDAEFLTIANGDEVFAQITPFLAQRPDLTSDTLSMTLLPTQLHWILGTNGLISSVSQNYNKDTVNASTPKPFKYEMSWFVQ